MGKILIGVVVMVNCGGIGLGVILSLGTGEG
jgi:hypothetical protein